MSLHDVDVARGEKSTRTFAMALPREIGESSDQFHEMLAAGHFFSLDDAPEVVIANSLLDDLGFDGRRRTALGQDDRPFRRRDWLTTGEQGQFEFQRKTLTVQIVGVFDPPDFGGFGPRSMRRSAAHARSTCSSRLPGLVESQLWRMRRQGVGRPRLVRQRHGSRRKPGRDTAHW